MNKLLSLISFEFDLEVLRKCFGKCSNRMSNLQDQLLSRLQRPIDRVNGVHFASSSEIS